MLATGVEPRKLIISREPGLAQVVCQCIREPDGVLNVADKIVRRDDVDHGQLSTAEWSRSSQRDRRRYRHDVDMVADIGKRT
jgi:hypothetical protein